MKKSIEITIESYNHRLLWEAAKKQFQASSIGEDAFYYRLAGLILSFFAFESYLNYVGKIISPDIWENEKKNFSQGKYKGTLGKYEFLCSRMNVDINKGKRPDQTIYKLKKFRDYVAHAEKVYETTRVEFKEGHLPKPQKTYVEKIVTEAFVRQVKTDIERKVNEIHFMLKRLKPDWHLLKNAFEPLHTFQYGEIR